MGFDLSGIGSVADLVSGVLGHFWPPAMTDEQKAQAEQAVTALVTSQTNTLVEAQKAIIVAELTQDDKYTKRARPSIIYVGLLIFLLNGVLTPLASFVTTMLGHPVSPPMMALPDSFWVAWASVTGIYAVGRSAEKIGSDNPIIQKITGSKT
ncbi:MAG: holin family protein [Deltaproteobacteria bacterium]|nr:holin family protein [Deltaproteobacteria bacterium]